MQEAAAEEPLESQGEDMAGGEHDAITADEAADLSSLAAAAGQEEPMAVVDEAAAAAAMAAASSMPLQSIRVLNPDGTLSEPPPGLLAGLGGVAQQQQLEAAPAAALLQQQEQLPQQQPQQYRVINAMTGEEVGMRKP